MQQNRFFVELNARPPKLRQLYFVEVLSKLGIVFESEVAPIPKTLLPPTKSAVGAFGFVPTELRAPN